MKTNDYLLVTATAGYSYLFYQQNAGINFLIFNVLFAALMAARNRELLKNAKWLWSLSLCLLSSTGILLTSSALAIIANCFSLLLISAISYNAKNSFIFSFIFSAYSVCSAAVWMVIDAVVRLNKNQKENGDITREKNYRNFVVLIVCVFVLLFFALYKQANPLFAENTKWISLDFVSISWIMFTLGGFFLVYPLFYHKSIPSIEKWENNLSLRNVDFENENMKKVETERFGGLLLFCSLNIMLIVLNVGDVTSIWFHAALPKGTSHSDFVHNGVGVIVFSIVIAIALVMFLHRKNSAHAKNTRLMKLMIYLWIVQNLLMLFSTAIRNQIYIHDFNFTYKRIGVYAWLILAAMGLVITFIKILDDRSNWFLIKSNFAIWFTALSITSLINWDLLITRYNLSNKPVKDVDFHYLFSLSASNIPELLAVTKDKEFSALRQHLKNYSSNRDYYYQEDYVDLLGKKIYDYMRDYREGWQSWDLRDERIMHALFKNK